MRRPAEAVCAAVNATAITVDRVIEANVGTVVMSDDVTRRRLFKDFELRFGWFADPFN